MLITAPITVEKQLSARAKRKQREEGSKEAKEGEEEGDEQEDAAKKAKIEHHDDEEEEEEAGNAEDGTGVEFEAQYPPVGEILDPEDAVEALRQRSEEDGQDIGEVLREAQRTIIHLWRESKDSRQEAWPTIRELITTTRQLAMYEDEALGWNKFIRGFKQEILDDENPEIEFWNRHFGDKRALGLIAASEDENKRIQSVHGRHADAFVKRVPLPQK